MYQKHKFLRTSSCKEHYRKIALPGLSTTHVDNNHMLFAHVSIQLLIIIYHAPPYYTEIAYETIIMSEYFNTVIYEWYTRCDFECVTTF